MCVMRPRLGMGLAGAERSVDVDGEQLALDVGQPRRARKRERLGVPIGAAESSRRASDSSL